MILTWGKVWIMDAHRNDNSVSIECLRLTVKELFDDGGLADSTRAHDHYSVAIFVDCAV